MGKGVLIKKKSLTAVSIITIFILAGCFLLNYAWLVIPATEGEVTPTAAAAIIEVKPAASKNNSILNAQVRSFVQETFSVINVTVLRDGKDIDVKLILPSD